jgi:hypothetical protein
LAAATARGAGGRRDEAIVAIARAMPITVTTHAAMMIQGLATSFTDLSCHRAGQNVTFAPSRI